MGTIGRTIIPQWIAIVFIGGYREEAEEMHRKIAFFATVFTNG